MQQMNFYCRSYCLLNMFRAPLCPSSGVREYYTSCCCLSYLVLGFQVVGMVWSWGLCVRFAGCSCSWAINKICNKNSSVASSWHFIPTVLLFIVWLINIAMDGHFKITVCNGNESACHFNVVCKTQTEFTKLCRRHNCFYADKYA